MAVKDVLPQIRKERGITQEELARKVFVTRQAVSRWENGETQPNTDTLRLLSKEFNVSINTLLGSPRQLVCQCCGMPLEDAIIGRNKDGSLNADYCKWCYDGGAFAVETMDEVIEQSAPYLAEATGVSLDEAVSFMGVLLPTLDRWKTE